MPSRNPSSRSLRADIAVLNPATGKMEFPKAERTDFPLSQKVIDYKRAEYDWLVKNADYEHSFEYFFNTAPSSVMALSRKQGSQERIAELEEIRKKSAVNFPVFRGQDAFETLDSKKAEQAVKEMLGGSYEESKRKQKYVGATGDGLYHTTEDSGYASSFGSAVIEGVIDSKHLLDIRSLAGDISDNIRKERGIETKRILEKERDALPELDKGIKPDLYMGIRYSEAKSVGRLNEGIEKTKNQTVKELEYPLHYIYARRYANQLVTAIAKQYEQNFGKKMPVDLGMTPKEKKSSDTSDGTYRALKAVVAEQLYKLKNQKQWNVLKTPFFRQVMKNTDFDAVAYHDYSFGGDQPCVAFKNPNQFKSYFGSKKVDKKSPNMFDAD